MKLIERLILASSNTGDTVLDPFCGVGTIPLCCQRYKRNCCAVEISPAFVALAQNKLRGREDNEQKLVAEEGL